MAKFFGVILTITLLAFANLSQAQTPQPKPISQGPDFSGLEKGQLTNGKLSPFQRRYINSMRRWDPARANEFEAQLKQKTSSIDQVLQAFKNVIKIREQIDSEAIFYRDGLLSKKALIRSRNESETAERLMFWVEENYKSDIRKRYGPAEKTAERAIQKFDLIKDAWFQKFAKASAKKREKMGLPKDMVKWLRDNIFLPPKSAGRKPPKTLKEDIKKNKDKPEVTNKPRRQDRGEIPKPKAEEDRIVEADEGGMLVGKSLKLSDLDGCGAFLKINWDEIMGFVSTPCPGLTGGRVATQADYLTYCNSIKRTRRYCGPPGPGTEKRIEISGIQGMPFNAFCLKLHFNILASKGDEYNSRLAQGNLRSVFKYDNGSRKLECYYVSKAQAKALYEQSKGIGPVAKTEPNKDPSPAKPVARAEPKKDCKPGGGLVGGVNCATERIGLSDTVNPTGNRRPRRNKDRSPAFASSTDPSTGETITSVGNPDGSRTVTKTDKDGNILSREKVR